MRRLSGAPFWISLTLAAAVLAVYASLPHHDFVNYDDPRYVTANDMVQRGLSWQGVHWALTTGSATNWHPLTWLSHMLDVQMFGMKAGGHHVVSLLIHTASTLLLFGTLFRMTQAVWSSAFVAALFALHPLRVESVAWVAERKDVLSTLFLMLTLWAYAGYVRRPGLSRYVPVVMCFALGLMAKPMLVTLPFLLLLLDVWPLRRIRLGAPLGEGRSGPSSGGLSGAGSLVLEKVPLFVLALASSIVTFIVQSQGGAVGTLETFPIGLRVENAALSYVAYARDMFWPAHLAPFYPYPRSLPWGWVAASVLALVGISVLAMRTVRNRPYLAVGWFWYLGTLVPVIGLVQVGQQSRADRYTYVPMIGLWIAITWALPELMRKWPYRRAVLASLAVAAIVGCLITTRRQVQSWSNSISLWRHTLDATGDNYEAEFGLGHALADKGRMAEALPHYEEALRLKPDYVEAHNNRGVALASLGRPDEAVAEYREALRLRPTDPEAHYNLGNSFAHAQRTREAIEQFSEAIRFQPTHARARNNLGVALIEENRHREAVVALTEALRLRPGNAEAHNNLAIALAGDGRDKEAIAHFNEAIRLQPDYAEAHLNCGIVMADNGELDEAVRHLEIAVRLDPNDQKVRQWLEDVRNKLRPR